MKQAITPNPAAVVTWSTESAELSEDQWATACGNRLIELRPSSEPEALRSLARDMARDLRHFHPAMAAEMEHEGGLLDD